MLPPALFHSSGGVVLSSELRLADWGTSGIEELNYLSLGVLNDGQKGRKLVLYDARRRSPRRGAPTRIRSRAPAFHKGLFLIGRLQYGNVNRLGGCFSPFSRRPSSSRVTITDAPGGGRALRMRYVNRGRGFAGLWTHLFDTKVEPEARVYLDARTATHLSFAVRGARGGERLLLKVADRHWEAKEDALEVGPLERYLPQGRISRCWQRASIPLVALPKRLDRKELASVVLAVRGAQRGEVYLRDLALSTEAVVAIPAPLPRPRSSRRRRWRKGMWLWETAALLKDPQALERLLVFCRRNGITDLFAQIPDAAKDGRSWDPGTLGPLIRALHDAGITLDALDGHPRLALASEHAKVYATIRTIIDYNAKVAARDRFDGIRYDNEIYLVEGFAGINKGRILRDYVTLLRGSHELTRGKLRLGADIPFWFDARNGFGEASAELDGRALSEHVIDLADNVAIMDYRTFSYGPDGVLAHARGELEYAAKQHKELFIALETVELPDEEIVDFTRVARAASAAYRLVLEPFGAQRVRLSLFDAGSWRQHGSQVRALGARVSVLAESRRVFVPSSKQTFARLGPAPLDEVMAEVKQELGALPSFVGFAIHSYESYAPLIRRAPLADR